MSKTAVKASAFLNFSSGRASNDEIANKLRERLGDVDIEICRKGADIADLAAIACSKGAEMLIAGGGDGTIRAVAEAAVRSSATLAVLPVGTLNHFARDLDIPLELDGAIATITGGEARPVDVGEVNGCVFINNSIIGLYPTYRFLRNYLENKGYRKRLSILWAMAAAFRRYPFLTLRMDVGGRQVVRRTPYVIVANNEHQMQGYHLGSRTTMNSGRLWIYIMKRRGRWGLIRMILSLMAGQFTAARDFEVFSAREIQIEARQKRLGVALDGEITILDLPLRYRSLPSALHVIRPPLM